MRTFRGNEDYLAEFENAVTALIDGELTGREARIKTVKTLIDEYVTEVGERPESIEIERLADYLLYEEITDTSRSKTFNAEYPFLSERQLERRYEREYSLDLAESYDLDGVNRAKPERRHRIAKEQRFVEKLARNKNRKRNAQYKRDTSAGPVVTYNLRDNGGELTEPFVAARNAAETWRERLSSVNV